LKPARFIDSVNCAIDGIIYTARTQKHMRRHFFAALALLLMVLLLRVTPLEFTVLTISVCFVLFAELFNTSIEVVVDMVSPGFSPLARTAKDVAAGGVLIAAIGAVVMGIIVLSRYIFPIYKDGLEMVGASTGIVPIIALLMVIITVVFLKTLSGRGTPMEGGLPSGHAAVAFSIATIVTFTTLDPMTSLLTFALAVMVSHSRLLLKIHTMREVVLGAIAGTAITLGVMLLFKVIY
jgi:diacylglycerol kinase (ATP)